MTFKLPTLPYSYDALEPYIDAKTMEIHHSKHHQAYLNKFLEAIAGTELENQSIEEILRNASSHSPAIRNNGGGYYNHNIYWESMTPTRITDTSYENAPEGPLAEAITKEFGSFDKFKEKFTRSAATHFGSGWAWLGIKDDGSLVISTTKNQGNPINDDAEIPHSPILALDVWEHAYYLKYQNRRPDYISAFWNVVNWEEVNRKYESKEKTS